ncbi:MAG: substrate-binding domain-containing protein [Myxococcales bacterium]
MTRHGLRLSVVACLSCWGAASGQEVTQLRVCADPDNLPFSNRQGEGLENRIAEVIGRDLGVPVTYFWWPQQRGFVRRTLGENQCDVVVGIPHDYDPVLTTKAYYRSTYVVVSRQSAHLNIRSLDDPALKRLRIGVHIDTPPWGALADRGLMDNVRGYPLMFDYRNSDPSRRPSKVLEDVVDGAIDVAIVWGPMAGWFAKKSGAALGIVPVRDTGKIPMSFDMSMGVRRSDKALKDRLETALDRRGAQIQKILADYGIPVVGKQ